MLGQYFSFNNWVMTSFAWMELSTDDHCSLENLIWLLYHMNRCDFEMVSYDSCIIWMGVTLCIHATMDDMPEQGSTVSSCWAAHAELRTWFGWIVPSCVSLLQPHLPIVVSVTSSECSNTREFYPHIPLQTFQRVFAGTRYSYIFSTSM